MFRYCPRCNVLVQAKEFTAHMTAHRNRERERQPIPGWQRIRRQVLERDGWRCKVCGSAQNLEVHHLHGWRDNRLEALETRCFDCHRHPPADAHPPAAVPPG